MKVVVIASYAPSLVHFRGELLQEMAALGHEVTAVAPDEREDVTEWLGSRGVHFTEVPIARTGLDPFDDIRTLRALVRVLREAAPDIVFAYTAKPVIYGLIAARLVRSAKRVALITGRGSALAGGDGLKRRTLGRLMRTLYRIALRRADLVFFQNPDDEDMFRSEGIVSRGQRCVRINGSGVDLRHFGPAPLPDAPLTFVMVGRLLREKGVLEYIEAARITKTEHPQARFLLLGGLDPNPSSIDAVELKALDDEGIVEYLGESPDVRPILASAHVIVLPSYHEGMPRSVLEAMSMGRAVITTDVPGCRETVEVGRNGILVPPRDPVSLARAMSDLIGRPASVAEMGAESRRIAEERFDVHDVNRVILDELGLSARTTPSGR